MGPPGPVFWKKKLVVVVVVVVVVGGCCKKGYLSIWRVKSTLQSFFQAVTSCRSLAAGLRGNGERMRKWRERGNGERGMK